MISFPRFFEVFVDLNKVSIHIKPSHRDLAALLQRAVLGQLNKTFIIINIPPRFGKTKMMEALVCWQMACFPNSHNIYTSYSAMLATASCRYIRETLDRPWYKELFPETQFGVIQQADNFNTTAGGVVYSAGTGGTITGFGAGLKSPAGGFIVLDDPTKPDEAMSKVVQESTVFWLENTLKSRRNSPHVPIILCMQRLATDDMSGYIMENYPDDYHLVKIPALVDGESIIPETVSTASLRATERVNPFAFNAQYQQEPIILGGNFIKVEWLRYYAAHEADSLKWEEKILTCDTALQSKQHNDFSVLQCWGRLNGKAYLIDHLRDRMDSPTLLTTSQAFFRKHSVGDYPVSRFIIEEAAAGPGLIQQLQLLGIPAEGIRRVKDKVARVMDILAFVRTGMVYHPTDVPWKIEVEAELAQFRQDGLAKHDDIVDSWADGIAQLLGNAISILDVLGSKPQPPQHPSYMSFDLRVMLEHRKQERLAREAELLQIREVELTMLE